ncbi:hypothetical protein PIB30_074784 [Stylosanthes scabra]|uniref:Uncharacterized protein n=1 Tax=Stylosanthes scabra TaxID=79078 RepID=A0ABU6WN08_9FABA|nr:hypothetical protein [Stylosanthes scabra]
MAHELFYFVVHPNGVIVQREKGASFESNGPVMFAHNCVKTLRELKQLILSHLGPERGRKIGNLAYRFQALRLEYRPSWISEDSHVWMTFEVHKRVMKDKVMKFYAKVRHTGCSSSFRPFVPTTATAPSMLLALEDVALRDYNSGDDSDYEDESSYATMEEDEEVLNTLTVGGSRLILPAPLPILDLVDVSSYFQ